MKELITSLETKMEFPKLVHRLISDFEIKKVKTEDYESKELSLLFPTRNFRCNYSMNFENDHFFFKINFEIDDEKFPDLQSKFYNKVDFLFKNKLFYSDDDKSIVLKSQIDDNLIERAHIIFATERWMKCYFFPETKIALEEIVLIIFNEFQPVMSQFWKTIIENFETLSLPSCFVNSSDNIPKDYLVDLNTENNYELPPIIKIYFDSYQRQKLEMMIEPKINKRKKNLVQRVYILMKKF